MRRFMLALAVVVVACGFALAQGTPTDPEVAKQQRKMEEWNKKLKEEMNVYFKKTSELPDLVAKLETDAVALPSVEVTKDDPPAVRAAKRAINAEAERYHMILERIKAGQFSGSAQYNTLIDCVFGQYAAATLLHDDPEKLLPYAEAVVVSLMKAELFNSPRVLRGVDEPQLLPQLMAARCRAEVVVIKLREQVKTTAVSPPATLIAPPEGLTCRPAFGPRRLFVRPLIGRHH
ncbi:MAG: hypothetical protein ACOVT5_14270 [Armatimonadaceae bacterium]